MATISLAYKVVYDKIMESLDKGVVPWKKTWTSGIPYNGKSKHAYRGINYWILICSGYSDPRWYTFKQITEMGGNVKGEKSTPVIFWTFFEKEDDKGNMKKVPWLKYYSVFNAQQVHGIDLPKLGTRDAEKNFTAEAIVAGYEDCPEIIYGKPQASYNPRTDTVNMPNQNTFDSDDNFYATLFHELAHSTGAEKRLNRDGIVKHDGFGSTNYSAEELVAELSSAFLSHQAGIESTLELSASYIEGWKKVFANDPKILVQSAGKAQKACDYILGVEKDTSEVEAEVTSAVEGAFVA